MPISNTSKYGSAHLEPRLLCTIANVSTDAAGTTNVIRRLATEIDREGWRVDVATIRPAQQLYGEQGPALHAFNHDFADFPLIRRLLLSNEFRRSVGRLATKADLIHDHGLWLMPNIYSAWAAQQCNKPFLVSTHGMLAAEAMAFSKTKKRIFWALFQASAARKATCFHATSEAEFHSIRNVGLTQPVAIIPNGVDIPELIQSASRSGATNSQSTALFLGRIHPIKGLDRLISAWGAIEDKHPLWRLVIRGPDELGYAEKLKRQASELGLNRIEIGGPLFGAQKTRLLLSSQIFILPSLNENFAITVAESLAAGTPVIATKGAPWQGLVDNNCGWWINHGPDSLALALNEAMCLSPEALRKMGTRGRSWMERDFSWVSIAKKMIEVYNWLVVTAPKPDTVRLC